MMRIEIIANHSVEENILEALSEAQVAKHYTRYPNVMGVGRSGPRMGDAIWPEENFALVIWCDEEEAQTIEQAVASVKERFPEEGIKLFGLRSSDGGTDGPADNRPREALLAPEREPETPDNIEGLTGLAGIE